MSASEGTLTLLVLALLAAFAGWIIWTLASGVLGITLGQILIYALFFVFGFVVGKSK